MRLVVEAPSWPALCEEAARAFGGFVGGGQAEGAGQLEAEPVTLAGADLEELWVRWWRALLRLWSVEGRLPVSAAVEAHEGALELRARPRVAELGALDPARCVDIKAVTWHEARVAREPSGTWRGQIVLDV